MGEYLPSTLQILAVTSKDHRIKENKTTALQEKTVCSWPQNSSSLHGPIAVHSRSLRSSGIKASRKIHAILLFISPKDVGAAHGHPHTCFNKHKNKSGMVAHTYNSTSQEAEIGGLLQVPGHPGLHSEFKPTWATE